MDTSDLSVRLFIHASPFISVRPFIYASLERRGVVRAW